MAHFNPNQFNRGCKYVIDLKPDEVSDDYVVTILLVRGCREGSTLVVTAGVHGDEFEGVRAIIDTYQSLDPNEMSGDFIGVPVANTPAFWNGTRNSPIDGLNLARVFPGALGCGPTPALAHALANSVIGWADFFVDLHSGGVKLLMPTMVGYDAADSRSRAAALVFGAEVAWGHPKITAGRTIAFAKEQGIPWLYTEARGAGRIDGDDLRVFVAGLRNVLRHLAILPGDIEAAEPRIHLYGEGDTDAAVLAHHRGFLIPEVELLEKITFGSDLGRTVNLRGETIEEFFAPSDGILVMIRAWPVVEPGDSLFLLTEPAQ